MRLNLSKNRGFTLVELLVVIAIIGLLASVVVVSVGSARAKARDSRRITDAKSIQSSMELYRDSNSGNAAPAGNLAALTPTYIATIPTDPGNNTYTYTNAGDDESWALQFTTEQDSSIGVAGNYCINSSAVEPMTGADCSAQER